MYKQLLLSPEAQPKDLTLTYILTSFDIIQIEPELMTLQSEFFTLLMLYSK